ncbi:DUF7576 family protein [Haloarcula onubensis]|uniref:Small CPxCG-related zinc finger protein n=1 Tax=Haloarcula onubensis TaxID=2950539 RepID=A0ABU2FKC4_9EURY|nr:hypothetical protein [Halomicroarcula sp. S3CR25-11]MDS0281205.1 hypothetical protein [Halomicroarcula sp. S3CR25-11]
MSRSDERTSRPGSHGSASARERPDDLTGMADRRADGHRQCVNCGGRITPTEWHPVRTERDGDDRLCLRHFCDEDCVAAWATER